MDAGSILGVPAMWPPLLVHVSSPQPGEAQAGGGVALVTSTGRQVDPRRLDGEFDEDDESEEEDDLEDDLESDDTEDDEDDEEVETWRV
jgi:hypothetical protein